MGAKRGRNIEPVSLLSFPDICMPQRACVLTKGNKIGPNDANRKVERGAKLQMSGRIMEAEFSSK